MRNDLRDSEAGQGTSNAPSKPSFFKSLPRWAKVLFVLIWPVSLTYAVYRMWHTRAFNQPTRIVLTTLAVLLALTAWASSQGGPSVTADTSTAPASTPAPQPPVEEVASPDATEPPAPTQTAPEPTPEPTAEPAVSVVAVEVTRIVDGDTIHVVMPDGTAEKVRFIGVDTPESTNAVEPYGKEASDYTTAALSGKTVYLETDAELRDRYDRLLAHVWLEIPETISDATVRQHLFNAHLVLAGYANLMTIPPNVRYVDYLTGYVSEARTAEAGLWRPAPPPAAAAAPAPSTPTASYIANRNTKKFHYATCSSVDDMKESNKVPYDSRDAAAAAGYIPCKRCNP